MSRCTIGCRTSTSKRLVSTFAGSSASELSKCVCTTFLLLRLFRRTSSVQGFLRRVHRWPILLAPAGSPVIAHDKTALAPDMSWSQTSANAGQSPKNPSRFQEPPPTTLSAAAELASSKAGTTSDPPTLRRTSLAESSLEQLRSREAQKHADTLPTRRSRGHRSDSVATITSEYFRRQSLNAQTTPPSPRIPVRMSPDMVANADLVDSEHSSGGLSAMTISRPRLSRSPSTQIAPLQAPGPPYPPDLLPMLDGEHHTDELCTKYEVGLPVLEQWLRMIGGGGDAGDFGQVAIIYR